MAPHINLGTRWRWAVSFIHWPVYPWGYSLCTHCVGGWVGLVWMQWSRENVPAPQGFNPNCSAYSLVTKLTELSWLWEGSEYAFKNV